MSETNKKTTPVKDPKQRINELLEAGKQKGVLSYKEIMDALQELELDQEAVEKVYETIEEQNTEDNMKLLIGLLPHFRAYDTHCYYCRYVAVPEVLEHIHVSMSMMDILTMTKAKLTAKTGRNTDGEAQKLPSKPFSPDSRAGMRLLP